MQLPLVFTQTLLLVGHAPLTDREVAFIQTWQGPIVCADGGLQYVQQTEDVWVIGDGDSYVITSLNSPTSYSSQNKIPMI